MKPYLTLLILIITLKSFSQSITPTINSYKRNNKEILEKTISTNQVFLFDSLIMTSAETTTAGLPEVDTTEQDKKFFDALKIKFNQASAKYNTFLKNNTWFMPFRGTSTALLDAFNANGHSISSVGNVLISPSFETNNASTVYVELISSVPWNVCRISLGSHLVKADLKDSTKTAQDIALSKLTNGGGNIVLNLSRPLIYTESLNKKGDVRRFVTCGIDLNGYADLSGLNQDVYNPGAGLLCNVSVDCRMINLKSPNGSPGNLVRIGLTGRNQFNVFNEKYKNNNEIDDQFKNLNITSAGGYLGLGPFNLQYTYNFFNKSGTFFNGKESKIRLEVIPIRF
jgi:hypothetical protein